ncbi:MAG TPA: ABC transporter ATP-binding protein [Pirellulaceae bacterium]|nr:ABC transporter ATP-binding protein [Pirellulaceae bacterium]
MNAELVARFVKRFGDKVVVETDLRRPTDRFSITVLFGPSGCGKTTTLRCLAGLERPEEGRITFEKKPWFDSQQRVFMTPQQREIGYLFQDYALFPHLTVAQNTAYGLRSVPSNERWRRVAEMLDLFQLGGLENRYPHQVSGGEQQRIALARVMVRRPRLLLLDEPLSALDAPTRGQLRTELRRLLVEFGIPVVLVTHDRKEAMTLADHLIVLDRGRVRQQGAVEEVFSRPADVEVARIVGMVNVQPGRVVKTEDGLATVAVGNTQLLALAPTPSAKHVHVCIQPEDVILQKGSTDHASPRNRLAGVVSTLTPEGPLVRVALDCGFPLVALVTRPACEELELREGEIITALVKSPSVHLIVRC